VPPSEAKMNRDTDKTRIAILGASGYTGAELLRILAHHPRVEIVALTADRQAGKDIGAVFPHLARRGLPTLVPIGEVDWKGVDLVFLLFAARDHAGRDRGPAETFAHPRPIGRFSPGRSHALRAMVRTRASRG